MNFLEALEANKTKRVRRREGDIWFDIGEYITFACENQMDESDYFDEFIADELSQVIEFVVVSEGPLLEAFKHLIESINSTKAGTEWKIHAEIKK